MRVSILAVGRLKRSAEADLVADYTSRFNALGRGIGLGPLDCIEIEESRLPQAHSRTAAEAQALRSRMPEGAACLVLDETGKDLTSRELAERMAGWRDRGTRILTCLIGGPDGLAADLRSDADATLRLGRLTWPHRLVRVMLAEQLYRSATILANHPYHREGRT